MKAVPNRSRQIDAITEFIDKFVDSDEERTTKDLAAIIVDGIYKLWTVDLTDASPPLRVGLAFKVPMVAKVYHVAWKGLAFFNGEETEMAWCVAADSNVGTLAPVNSDYWRIIKESTAKAGAPGNNKAGYQAGDMVTLHLGSDPYHVLATADKCVLLRRDKTLSLECETNDNLKTYYRKWER
ncbi:MAG TPA: hypothetical protein VIY48_19150 [Candidatus Paceibacterota bacterium]